MPVPKSPRVMRLQRLNNHYDHIYPLVMGRHWPVVHGLGDVLSPVIFVDAIPRKAEMRMGKPFIGEPGNLFSKMLRSIDMDRSAIFYTYLNKYEMNRRVPFTPAMSMAGYVLLHWELNILRPRLVVLMGVRVARVFCPDIDSDGLKGQVLGKDLHHGDRTRVMPIVHPSSATLSSKARSRLSGQFQHIAEVLGS